MLPRRRLVLALALAGLVAAPAGVLAALCVGNACQRAAPPQGPVPFCSLPSAVRSQIAAGFRDGRSPHILAVTAEGARVDDAAPSALGPWPSLADARPKRVPLGFSGTGVARSASVPPGTTLDAVAPTVAEIIGLDRPHPRVRSGQPVGGVASGERPRIVVLVVWKGVSSAELERRPAAWPTLRGLLARGTGSLAAVPGSVPLDPAAIVTTIGTGGLPRDHGITGALVRNDDGEVVEPWTRDAPFSVIAGLGDDLDELRDQAPRIGLVGSDRTDRGLIGGTWYVRGDRDDVAIASDPQAQAARAAQLLASGYGADETPDLLTVASEGRIADMDAALSEILDAARRTSGGSVAVAVTAIPGGAGGRPTSVTTSELERDVAAAVGSDVIDAFVPGGAFLDQEAMTAGGLSDDRVVTALRRTTTPDGRALFADVFPAIAVTFARYC